MGADPLIISNPDPDDLRNLEEAIYEFNVQATGISDGKLFASFLRVACRQGCYRSPSLILLPYNRLAFGSLVRQAAYLGLK